jgi:predicted dehydrogenase
MKCAEFVDAILEERPYLGNLEEGVAAMRMIDALYRSAREGRVARV